MLFTNLINQIFILNFNLNPTLHLHIWLLLKLLIQRKIMDFKEMINKIKLKQYCILFVCSIWMLINFEKQLCQIFLLILGSLSINTGQFKIKIGILERSFKVFLAVSPVIVLIIHMTCFQIIADWDEPKCLRSSFLCPFSRNMF